MPSGRAAKPWLVGTLLLATYTLACTRDRDVAPAASASVTASASPRPSPFANLARLQQSKLRSVTVQYHRGRTELTLLGEPAWSCSLRHGDALLRCVAGVLHGGDASTGRVPWTVVPAEAPNPVPEQAPDRWLGIDREEKRLRDYFGQVRGSFVTEQDELLFVIGQPVSEERFLYRVKGADAPTEVPLPKAARAVEGGLQLIGEWLLWQERGSGGWALKAVRASELASGSKVKPLDLGSSEEVRRPKHACWHERGLRAVFEGPMKSTQAVVEADGKLKLVSGPPANLSVDDIDPHVPKLLSRFTCTDSGFILSWAVQHNAGPGRQTIDVHALSCSETSCSATRPLPIDLHGMGMFPTVPVVPVGDRLVALWSGLPKQGLRFASTERDTGETIVPRAAFAGHDVELAELFSAGSLAYAVLVVKGEVYFASIDGAGQAAGVPIETVGH